ncbi:unnamed protein product [Ophioblennius macclurei]
MGTTTEGSDPPCSSSGSPLSGSAAPQTTAPPLANMDYAAAHNAMRERWKQADANMCKHSMSFHLHHTLRSEFFASYLYLVVQIPLVKLFPLTCEFQEGEKTFYYRAQKFYDDVPDTEEGMMGDFLEVSDIDLEGSRRFLSKFMGPGKAGSSLALDCGSGIGRVSRSVLLPVFQKVDLVDMVERFLLTAHQDFLGPEADRVQTLFCYNLQDFSPTRDTYDVVWIQWVACHLTDKDLMNFLRRCRKSLRPDGVIILKDNMARHGAKLDVSDSSVSRHLDIMRAIIAAAGLEILEVEHQEGFPDIIMPVWMIAMR